jgi:hypothetical protein
MKEKQCAWVNKWGHLLSNPHAPVAFLDKKMVLQMQPATKAKGLATEC